MKNGTESLLSALHADDPYIRMVTAERLAAYVDVRTTDALLTALQDPVPDVRRVVARSLGIHKDSKAIPPLLDSLLDMEIHSTVARTLHVFTDREHLPYFTTALTHESVHIRKVAASLLQNFEGPDVITPLRLAAGDVAWTVRKAALQSLKHFPLPQAVESLLDGLEDERAEVRHAASEALKNYHHAAALEPLSRAAHHETEYVRKIALQTLGLIGSPTAIPILINAFEDPSPEVREAASNALLKRGEPVVVDVLIRALKHTDIEISKLAATTLQAMDHKRIALPVSEALTDSDFHHRVHGFAILSTINFPISVLPLVNALGDPNPSIRSIAANTLRTHSPTDVIPALIDALVNDQIEDQGAAIELLGTLDHPDILKPLLRAMSDEDPTVRARAADALDKYTHPIASSDLAGLIDHPSASHRELGARLLGRSRDEEAIVPLVALLKDSSLTVQTEAIDALSQFHNKTVVDALSLALQSDYFQIRQPALVALERMQALHPLAPLLENLRRWDAEAMTIPAQLMVSLFIEGKRQSAQAISDSLLFHLHPKNKNELERLHLNDSKGKTTLSALQSLLDAGEWRHLAFFTQRELTGMGYLILKMIRLLTATYNLQKFEAELLVCKEHLCRFVKHKRNGLTYLGCRLCGETHLGIKTKEIVAVLDNNMDEQVEKSWATYRVNWLENRKVVDFDRVEIGRCSEEIITEFCIDIGNDSDPYRSKHHRNLTCSVQKDLDLSNEVLALLNQQFKSVNYL